MVRIAACSIHGRSGGAGRFCDRSARAPDSLSHDVKDDKRVIADEGVFGTLRILGNLLRRPDARRRVLGMRQTFRRHRQSLAAVAIVGVVPSA